MSRPFRLYEWQRTIATHLTGLSGPQARVLAAWSFATVTLGTCGRETVAAFLAEFLHETEDAVRQRLREWYCEPAAKKGAHRRALPVATCFAALLGWVLAWWPADERQLAVALDATTLHDRFTVLTICVLYRSCAIPIAWTILPAGTPGGWRPHWLALLQLVNSVIPPTWTVVALADRGLYAPWLYRALKALFWHPFLRLNTEGHYRPVGARVWRALAKAAPRPGTAWSGAVKCFKARPVEATLLARWEAGYADPWLILTDLTPEQANISWYAWRAWIECSFRTTKRGAWQWQNTKMTDPQRAAGLWLVLAVATLWSVSVGGAAEVTRPVSSFERLPARHIARRSGPQPHPPPAAQRRAAGPRATVSAVDRGPRRARMASPSRALAAAFRRTTGASASAIASYPGKTYPCKTPCPPLHFVSGIFDLFPSAAPLRCARGPSGFGDLRPQGRGRSWGTPPSFARRRRHSLRPVSEGSHHATTGDPRHPAGPAGDRGVFDLRLRAQMQGTPLRMLGAGGLRPPLNTAGSRTFTPPTQCF